jgi:hypothetical protein
MADGVPGNGKKARANVHADGVAVVEGIPETGLDVDPHRECVDRTLPISGQAGAAERIRTSDPRITNALLYRLSYRGVLAARGNTLNM